MTSLWMRILIIIPFRLLLWCLAPPHVMVLSQTSITWGWWTGTPRIRNQSTSKARDLISASYDSRPQTHSPTQYQSRTLSNPRQQHERTTTYPEQSSPGLQAHRVRAEMNWMDGQVMQRNLTRHLVQPTQKGCSLKRVLKTPSLILAWCPRRPQSHRSIRPVDYPTHRVQPSPVIIRTWPSHLAHHLISCRYAGSVIQHRLGWHCNDTLGKWPGLRQLNNASTTNTRRLWNAPLLRDRDPATRGLGRRARGAQARRIRKM